MGFKTLSVKPKGYAHFHYIILYQAIFRLHFSSLIPWILFTYCDLIENYNGFEFKRLGWNSNLKNKNPLDDLGNKHL